MKSGHWQSVKQKEAVNAQGLPVPWCTYPAIAYLDRLDLDGLRVFEWGLGNSTRYWERRGCQVTGVDDSPEWFDKVSARTNAAISLTSDRDTYVGAVGDDRFDIISIDGEWRDDCAALAPDRLAEGGLIVFDNSDRHPDACRSLRDAGFIQLDFYGIGPLNTYAWTTSMFLRGSSLVPHPDLPLAAY